MHNSQDGESANDDQSSAQSHVQLLGWGVARAHARAFNEQALICGVRSVCTPKTDRNSMWFLPFPVPPEDVTEFIEFWPQMRFCTHGSLCKETKTRGAVMDSLISSLGKSQKEGQEDQGEREELGATYLMSCKGLQGP